MKTKIFTLIAFIAIASQTSVFAANDLGRDTGALVRDMQNASGHNSSGVSNDAKFAPFEIERNHGQDLGVNQNGDIGKKEKK